MKILIALVIAFVLGATGVYMATATQQAPIPVPTLSREDALQFDNFAKDETILLLQLQAIRREAQLLAIRLAKPGYQIVRDGTSGKWEYKKMEQTATQK